MDRLSQLRLQQPAVKALATLDLVVTASGVLMKLCTSAASCTAPSRARATASHVAAGGTGSVVRSASTLPFILMVTTIGTVAGGGGWMGGEKQGNARGVSFRRRYTEWGRSTLIRLVHVHPIHRQKQLHTRSVPLMCRYIEWDRSILLRRVHVHPIHRHKQLHT